VSDGPTSASPWLRARIAIIDRLVALVLAPILAPAIAVLGWKVKRGDGGPPLIGLARVGRDGAPFTMWKLRSMRAERSDGAAAGAVVTATDDDRITPIGATMRRWRLDELPQIWNVLRGDMGLLGPRPETPTMVDAADPRWRAVCAVRPGVSGPTQLVVEQWEAAIMDAGSAAERYRDQIMPVKLAIDRWYVERATPATDVAVACSMVERFALGREETWIERIVRAQVPEAAKVPVDRSRRPDAVGAP
jgi:lipopolysaccharide/colanic/teichoic acid biosynthesis glycosyltransferase